MYRFFNKLVLFVILISFGSVVVAREFYGAIYINKNTGIAGGSIDAYSYKQANTIARNSCIQKHRGRSNGCVYVGGVTNGCVAVYWSPITKTIGWNWATHQSDAERTARNACIRAGGQNCQLRHSICTSRNVYY